VAKHKAVFFRAASAKYDEAQQGTLRLVPPDTRQLELRSDYSAMAQMFFDAIPAFETIIARIAEFETLINRK